MTDTEILEVLRAALDEADRDAADAAQRVARALAAAIDALEAGGLAAPADEQPDEPVGLVIEHEDPDPAPDPATAGERNDADTARIARQAIDRGESAYHAVAAHYDITLKAAESRVLRARQRGHDIPELAHGGQAGNTNRRIHDYQAVADAVRVAIEAGTPMWRSVALDAGVDETRAKWMIEEARRLGHLERPATRSRGGVPGTVDFTEVARVVEEARAAGRDVDGAIAAHFGITHGAASQRRLKATRLGHVTAGVNRPRPTPAPPRPAPTPTRVTPPAGPLVLAVRCDTCGKRVRPDDLDNHRRLHIPSGLGPIDPVPFDPQKVRDEQAGPPVLVPDTDRRPLRRPNPADSRPTNPRVGDVWTPERATALLDQLEPDGGDAA